MKRLIFSSLILLISTLLLAGCGTFPPLEPVEGAAASPEVTSPPPPTETPPPEEVTALPPPPMDTPVPTHTETSTPTETPTETLTPTITETPTITLTPTLTPTITLTPTATLPSTDPRLSLGLPLWSDTFDNADNWNPYDGEISSAQIRSGQFLFIKYPSYSGAEWILTHPDLRDFYLEVTVQTPISCGGKDRFGLIFRAPNVNTGYFFAIACDGTYRLTAWDGTTLIKLEEWKQNLSIFPGPGQINRMGVMADGNTISVYVNGIPLVEVVDDTFPNSGRFGFFIGTSETANFIVAFDDLYLWRLR